jgi:hypothetical protein
MSTNSILATAPLVTTNFLLRATGTTIGNSLIFDNGTNVGIGNTNTTYTLDVSGTGNFTGALSGTSATFSGDLTIDTNTLYVDSTNNEVGIGTINPSGKLHLSSTSDTYFVMTGGGTPLTYSLLVDSTNLRLFSGVGATTLLTIASTGAATFSSSVNMGGDLALTPNDSAITFSSGAGRFFTGGQEKMRITSGNDIGIGATTITNPNSLSRVVEIKIANSVGIVLNDSRDASPIGLENRGAVFLLTYGTKSLLIADGASGHIGIGVSPSNGRLEVLRTTDGSIAFLSNSFSTFSGNALTIDVSRAATAAYNLIWAQANNSAQFYVTGSGVIYAKNATVQVISSDYNLKTDIKDYDKGLNEVLSMKPRYFKYKDDLDNELVGFIAQEMGEAIKGSLVENKEGNKSYQIDWYPLLVKAIQEQQALITSLQEQINELKNK